MSKQTDIARLGIEVDASLGIESMNTLASAIERVNKALDELNGKDFGKIEIHVVGQLATVEVKSNAE